MDEWGFRDISFFIGVLSMLMIVLLSAADAKELIKGPIDAYLVKVTDGDTIVLKTHPWLDMSILAKVRIRGVDTAELRGKCEKEKIKAKKSKSYLEVFLRTRRITISNVDYGKYAGRVVADVHADGISVAYIMALEGGGRSYLGGKRKSWCKK